MSGFMFKPRNEDYNKEVAKMKCFNYAPCPVCFKCTSRAIHLYAICDECAVPLCAHSQKDRAKLIRPENFTVKITGELADDIRTTYNEYIEEKEGILKC